MTSADYLGQRADGFHSPGFAGEAVRLLVEHRGITSLGTDTSSIDAGRAPTPIAHQTLLGAGRYGVEGLTNLAHVPAAGATLVIGVVPWENGTGGPCRALALR
jgi:kynurenine formamidase